MSTSKSLVLAFIWILLLSFIFILFVYILGGMQKTQLTLNADYNTLLNQGIYSADSNVGATVQHSPAIGLQILEVYRPSSSYCLQCVYGFSAEMSWWRIIYRVDGPNPVFNNWLPVLTNIPSFYKNYQTLAELANAISNNVVNIPTGSFASLQGKNYQSFRWINDGVSTPMDSTKSTTMGRCITSPAESQYTMIDIWHIATPSIIYHGLMSNGVVSSWYQIDMTQKT